MSLGLDIASGKGLGPSNRAGRFLEGQKGSRNTWGPIGLQVSQNGEHHLFPQGEACWFLESLPS